MKKVTLNELQAALKELMTERGMETFIGSMPSSRGLMILLFSHRFNEDTSIFVTGTDSSRILAKVHEVLSGGEM